MRLTQKEQLALLLVSELVIGDSVNFLSLNDFCDKHGLSLLFMKKIAGMLKNSNIIFSKEGSAGGYKLVTDPNKISVYDIFHSVSESKSIYPKYLDRISFCPINKCLPQSIYSKTMLSIEKIFQKLTLSDLVYEKIK